MMYDMIRYKIWNDVWYDKIYDMKWCMILYIYLTAIGLTPGGSSTVHIYTNKTQNTENGTYT
jgi:hypothetical protein